MKLHPLTNHLRSYDASWNWGFGKLFFRSGLFGVDFLSPKSYPGTPVVTRGSTIMLNVRGFLWHLRPCTCVATSHKPHARASASVRQCVCCQWPSWTTPSYQAHQSQCQMLTVVILRRLLWGPLLLSCPPPEHPRRRRRSSSSSSNSSNPSSAYPSPRDTPFRGWVRQTSPSQTSRLHREYPQDS